MSKRNGVKAIGVLVNITLLLVAAVLGGLVAYLFTIYPYVAVPNSGMLSITDLHFDVANAESFDITVLNPSFSPSVINLTGISVKRATDTQLFRVTATDPPLGEGIPIAIGATLTVTCSRVQSIDANMTWGQFVSTYAGETVTIITFASAIPASTMDATLPYVVLSIAGTEFDPAVSFKNFTVTVTNEVASETSLVITDVTVDGVDMLYANVTPGFPFFIANGTTQAFRFTNASWYNLKTTKTTVTTNEGYVYTEDLELPTVPVSIQSVVFDENDTSNFNVTVFSFPESASYVNVTRINATLTQNATTFAFDYDPSVGLLPNSTRTFTVNLNWREYRGSTIDITVFFLQEFQTETFSSRRPPLVTVKALNATFDLANPAYFNLTLLNHPSSIEGVNITAIEVNSVNVSSSTPALPYGVVQPNENVTFLCNLNWASIAGSNMTIKLYVRTNQSLEDLFFTFVFQPPGAELNITEVNHLIQGYLNVTMQSLNYSLINVTVSTVTITLENQTTPFVTQVFPPNQLLLRPGENATLLCVFDWTLYVGQNITVKVMTDQGVQATFQGTNW
jgi:hypothetical protein